VAFRVACVGVIALCQSCSLSIPAGVSPKETTDFEKAVIEDCASLPQSKNSKASKYFLKAEKEFDSMHYEAAVKSYSVAIEADPNYTHAYAARGVVQKKLGNWREAINDYKRALDLYPPNKPKDGCILDNIGNAYSRLGEFATALSYHDRAHKLSPANPTILSNRGSTKLSAKDYSGAIRDFRKSLSLMPDRNFAILGIAEALLLDDQPRESITYFDEAIDLYDRPQDYMGRGFAYFYLGNTVKACSDWQIALGNGLDRLSDNVQRHCK